VLGIFLHFHFYGKRRSASSAGFRARIYLSISGNGDFRRRPRGPVRFGADRQF